ncbi:hypothetical protein [Spirulina sp. 06S082]|uniref:hypothetical protein n=1 Tax=Spirulina sp. 06S082 TaxID=3110248 RepID=UPI002B211FF0|nr:hypothetical protein [Spirulina sp. 06S082]MEA5468712.1 hypothetical protein [Spirulina sp. 06S082]
MERGLLWLPLLFGFFGLAWAGWNEYQKLESYRSWAKNFDNAKYDIYAVLAHKGCEITWGKPTRKAPVNLQTFSLQDVAKICLLVNECPIDEENLPQKGAPVLEFCLTHSERSIKIPFTEIELAAKWRKYLEKVKNE